MIAVALLKFRSFKYQIVLIFTLLSLVVLPQALLPQKAVARSTNNVLVIEIDNGTYGADWYRRTTVRVYGPSGYYKSKTFIPTDNSRKWPTLTFTWNDAPAGSYRIQGLWHYSNINDSTTKTKDWYGSLFSRWKWWQEWAKVRIRMPW